MQYIYHPKNKLEKFGKKVYPAPNLKIGKNLDTKIHRSLLKSRSPLIKFGVGIYSVLVENFFQTFFVGGMVRDLLLNKSIKDIDITTEAEPAEIIEALQQAKISYDDSNKKYGSIIAKQGTLNVEITTLRTDEKGTNRYHGVTFITKPKIDSQRRDFTINSLYLSLNKNSISDFQNGLKDIKSEQIKFIGNPALRIKQDPLRIIRALRFALQLNFNFEKKTKLAIKNNFNLLNNLTKTKLNRPKGQRILTKQSLHFR